MEGKAASIFVLERAVTVISRGWGTFIPSGWRQRRCSIIMPCRLRTVEINNTFYRLPKESVLQGWAEKVPDEFRFVLKAPQRITDIKRLKDAEAEVDSISRCHGLGFEPPHLRKDIQRLNNFLSLLPEHRAVAFEFCHPSCSMTRCLPA